MVWDHESEGSSPSIQTMNNYQKTGKARYVKNREWLNSKKNVPCTDCGKKYHFSLMQFDHLTDRKFYIGSHAHHSIKKLIAEIEKCEVVCVLCHCVRTWNRQHPEQQISSQPIDDIL